MAITAANLTSGGDTAAPSTRVSASISPGANRLLIATVDWTPDSGAAAPTVTGNGLTWVLISSGEYGGAGGGRCLAVFRAMGAAPSAGAVTFTFPVSNASANWSIDKVRRRRHDGYERLGRDRAGHR